MSNEEEEFILLASHFLNIAAEVNSIDDENNDSFTVPPLPVFDDPEENVSNQQEEIDDWKSAPLNECRREEDILFCVLNMIELVDIISNFDEEKSGKRERRWGVHPINELRREHGHFQNLFQEMLVYDHAKFFNYTRMSPERFNDLLRLVGPAITKNAPNAIPPDCRLLIKLR